MAYEAGAFPGSPFSAAAMTTLAPYNIENLKIDAFDVVLNRPKVAAYRAPGAPSSAFACECVIDELAEKCGIDPLDFRIMNGAHEGTQQPAGRHLSASVVSKPAKRSVTANTTARNSPAPIGDAVWPRAFGLMPATNPQPPSISIPTARVSVVTGSVDIGGSRASMAMVAAEVLGCDINDVRPSDRRH